MSPIVAVETQLRSQFRAFRFLNSLSRGVGNLIRALRDFPCGPYGIVREFGEAA